MSCAIGMLNTCLYRRTSEMPLTFRLQSGVHSVHSTTHTTMSQAHRPTWNPTQGRETKAGSRQVSKLSLPQYTKLKFRQPGQTSSSEVQRRDLKAELAEAERKAIEKKRKAAGLPDFEIANNGALRIEGEEGEKKRKVGEVDLDADDDDDEDVGGVDKGKGKAVDLDQDEDEDDDEEEDSDE
jgi:protein CWC15